MNLVHLDRIMTLGFDMCLRSLILLLAAGCAALAMRRCSAAARSRLWQLTFLALAILPVAAATAPPMEFAVLQPPLRSVQRTGVTGPSISVELLKGEAPGGRISTRDDAVTSPRYVSDATEPPYPSVTPKDPIVHREARFRERLAAFMPAFVLTLWSGGFIILLGRTGAGLVTLRRIARQCRSAPAVAAEARNAAGSLGIGRRVVVCTAPGLLPSVSPMTWGALRPVLLLPSGTESWPEGRLRAVLLHEMAHIARGDWAARLLADLACCFFWPNPLVWISARQLRRESELACDDRVLGCGIPASEYARHLLEIVRIRKSREALPAGAVAIAEPSLLETRLRAALEPSRARLPLSGPAGAAMAGLVTMALLLLATGRLTARVLGGAADPLPAGRPAESRSLYEPTIIPESSPPASILHSAPARELRGAATRDLQPTPRSVAWGRSVRGLQVGLERLDAGPTITPGQCIELRLWVRNSGQKPITVPYLSDQRANGQADLWFWTALTQNHSRIEIRPELSRTGERTSSALTLKPGEVRLLPMPEMRFVVSEMGNSAVTEPTIFAVPGKRKATAYPFVALSPDDAWMQTGIDPAFVLLLKAHETVVFNHQGFVIGDQPGAEPPSVPKGLENWPYLDGPTPGNYTVEQQFVYHISTREEVKRLADRSHSADKVIIEPFAVSLIRQDGSTYRGEATTVPYSSEKSVVITGKASFSVRDSAVQPAGEPRHSTPDGAGIAWGEASDGLQAGLRAPKGRTRYPLGSTVAMDYLIRNVGQNEISFDHDVFPNVSGQIPEVVSAAGKPANTFGYPLGATSAVKHETLSPGQMVVIGQTAMGVAAKGVPWYESRSGQVKIKPSGEKTYTYMNGAPGSYRMRVAYTMFKPDFRKVVLYTGYRPLELFEAAAVIQR